jgi:energy-coupling factor transporter ATP-binding protein EcfA2
MSGRENGAPREEPLSGYLSRVEIENIRSIASLRWEAPPRPGWNVVLGDNGSGKSTFLRSIAYAFIPPDKRSALRLYANNWVRNGASSGKIDVSAHVRRGDGFIERTFSATLTPPGGSGVRVTSVSQDPDLDRIFSASFGPFRRFTGGDTDYEKQFAALPSVARHLSLFDERVSLTESLVWLRSLRFKELERDEKSSAFLGELRAFVNQDGFLPNGARLDRITSDSVSFVDGNGAEVPVDELSDGYRSILSLTFELIRQLAAHHGPERVFDTDAKSIIAPGIVLIDEVDAHLHPSWQRRIGIFLHECFPNLQFIVTTHSPLVCQAAEVGTVFQLPRPGMDEEGRIIHGPELDRLLYGDLADAFATQAMGAIGRSENAEARLVTLAALNRKEIDHGLTDEERRKQRRLRAMFPAAREPGS